MNRIRLMLMMSMFCLTSLNAQDCDPDNPQCPEGQYCEQTGEIIGPEVKRFGRCMPASTARTGEGGVLSARLRPGTRTR